MSYSDKEKNAAYAREWYHNNKKRLREDPAYRQRNAKSVAVWRRNNREAAMLSAAKARAKRFGYNFNITIDDIVIPDKCPVLDIPIYFIDGHQHDGTPALDRVKNDAGYIKGNVQVISHKANRHKSDLSPEDIRRLNIYVNDLK